MGVGLLSAAQLAAAQATVADRYNNATRDAAHPADITVRVSIHQDVASESRVGRDEQVSDWIARLPAGTDITGRDQLIVDARTFEVIGPPEDYGTHIHAVIRYVEG